MTSCSLSAGTAAGTFAQRGYRQSYDTENRRPEQSLLYMETHGYFEPDLLAVGDGAPPVDLILAREGYIVERQIGQDPRPPLNRRDVIDPAGHEAGSINQ